MHRHDILTQLQEYIPLDDGDAACSQRFIEFVEQHPQCFSRELQKGHVTGSSWLVDPTKTKVLLTYHRKLDKWLQLGGHADGENDVLGVALREAHEESGIAGIRPLSQEIFDLDIHHIPVWKSDAAHYHYDIRFVLQAATTDFTVSVESLALEWVDIQRLEQYTTEHSIMRMKQKWHKLEN